MSTTTIDRIPVEYEEEGYYYLARPIYAGDGILRRAAPEFQGNSFDAQEGRKALERGMGTLVYLAAVDVHIS